jgi:hypothetical protein
MHTAYSNSGRFVSCPFYLPKASNLLVYQEVNVLPGKQIKSMSGH